MAQLLCISFAVNRCLQNGKTYTGLAENSTYQNPDDSPKYEYRTLPQFTTSQDDWLAAEANYKNQQNVIAQTQRVVNQLV